jgi:hypothetical protein
MSAWVTLLQKLFVFRLYLEPTPIDCELSLKVTMEQSFGLTPVDYVNHPPHYTQGDIECIDAMRAALGSEGFKSYCRGACIKYLWRTEHKNGVEDLRKCRWYLDRLIEEALRELN